MSKPRPQSEIMEEQILYYRARAAEYDETSDWRIDPFDDDWKTPDAALGSFRPGDPTLEIACGTGQWTRTGWASSGGT